MEIVLKESSMSGGSAAGKGAFLSATLVSLVNAMGQSVMALLSVLV